MALPRMAKRRHKSEVSRDWRWCPICVHVCLRWTFQRLGFFGWVPRSTQAIGKQFKKADAGSAERRKGFVGGLRLFFEYSFFAAPMSVLTVLPQR